MTKANKEEMQAEIDKKLDEMKTIMYDMKTSVDSKIDKMAEKVD